MLSANAKKRRIGIRGRWVINILALVVAVILILVSAVGMSIAVYYYSNINTTLKQKALSTANFFNNYLNTNANEFHLSSARYAAAFEEKNKLELQFLYSNGRIMVSSSGIISGMRPNTLDIVNALEYGEMTPWIGNDPYTGEKIIAVTYPLFSMNNQIIGGVRYVSSMRLIDGQIRTAFLSLLAAGGIVILIVIMSNMFFIRSIVNPIREINDIAKKIAEGNYGAKIEKNYNDEIGELCDTINDMSTEISKTEKLKSEFISSVSHELRTPLTAINGWGETILYMEDAEDMRKGVEVMVRESQRLNKLVEDLLEFTLTDSGRMKLRIERIDVAAEFEEFVFVYMEALKKQNITISYTSDGDIPEVEGDSERIKQVFYNIMDNAVKYSEAGGRIDAGSGFDGEFVNLFIEDFGPGIPEEDLPYVKQKFYKGASSARGSGIGLAVANEIVALHSGELLIESAVGVGTKVTVRLPCGINV